MLHRSLSGEVKDAKMKVKSFSFLKWLFIGMLDFAEIDS